MSSIIGVAALNKYISLKIGADVKLKDLTVRGELSDFKIHYKSGHAYFTLKENGSQIKGVMFARQAARLTFTPENGMNVLCSGNVDVYEAGGVYQIIANEIIPVGLGAKFVQLNAVKEKLSKAGIFAAENKKEIPVLPHKIAVVTSLNGAALQDVLNILKRRYPAGEVLIFPAQVQGECAHITIADALKKADNSGADVLILTRGGGSFEDLMPFNTEQVAVAVAQCVTPVISAVGHETDTTLADYAADKRAPTPSAAAEICSPTTDTMLDALKRVEDRLTLSFAAYLSQLYDKLDSLEQRLLNVSPEMRLGKENMLLDTLDDKLNNAFNALLASKTARLNEALTGLEALSPYNVLGRGYSITLKNGTAVTSADELCLDDTVVIKFRNFSVKAKITEIIKG